ncbi:MAG: translation initiation factor IF-2 subunit beta [Promethearchaeota archaeon]
MEEEEYIKLLDKALAKIPDEVKATERWEIPKVNIIYDGKTTIIKNWKQIIESLGRDEKHLFKKICKNLGAAGEIQKNRTVFRSIIKQAALNKQIEQYAKEYVICESCGKPDTTIIKEGRNHVVVCQACGRRRIIKL